jgi:hypothetical protein
MNRLPCCVIAVLLLLPVLLGCADSDHPIYSDDVIVQDDRLIGDWININPESSDPKQREVTHILKGADKTYKVESSLLRPEDGNIHIHLVKIGENTFVDAQISDPKNVDAKIGHWIMAIKVEDNHVWLGAFKNDRLLKLGRDHKPKLNYRESWGRMILTSATPDLQDFLRTHGYEPFELSAEFERKNLRPE